MKSKLLLLLLFFIPLMGCAGTKHKGVRSAEWYKGYHRGYNERIAFEVRNDCFCHKDQVPLTEEWKYKE